MDRITYSLSALLARDAAATRLVECKRALESVQTFAEYAASRKALRAARRVALAWDVSQEGDAA